MKRLQKIRLKGTVGETCTGFGMPLVKAYIEMHQGTISVRSWEKGLYPDSHGTEVMITLQCIPAH